MPATRPGPVEVPTEIDVHVPDGATPGTKLRCALSWGQYILVTVPPNVTAGQTFTVQLPPLTSSTPSTPAAAAAAAGGSGASTAQSPASPFERRAPNGTSSRLGRQSSITRAMQRKRASMVPRPKSSSKTALQDVLEQARLDVDAAQRLIFSWDEADQADEELRKKEEVDLLKMHRQMKLRKLQAEEFALAKQVETAERDRILADHAEHEKVLRQSSIDKVQKRQNYDAVVSNMLGRQTAPLPIMAKSISMLKSKANSARTAVEMKSKGGEGGVATAAAAAAVVATPASSTNPFEHPGFQEGGNPGGVELLPPPYITPSPSTLSPSPPTSLPSAETRPWHSLPLLPDMSMPALSEEQQIELAMQESLKTVEREDVIMRNQEALSKRLHDLHLVAVEMLSDGNCQFRSLSKELFRTADHHAVVREVVTSHMIRNHADYKDQTWGDELTLRAASEVYNVKINVITSDTENWHLLYIPSVIEDESTCREAFLCYIRPVHYNSVRIVT
eukprot:gene2864-15984_t